MAGFLGLPMAELPLLRDMLFLGCYTLSAAAPWMVAGQMELIGGQPARL
jgi:hypothetical protein